jgi:hypothetical protein
MMNFRNTTFVALTGYATRIQGVQNAFFDTCIWSKATGNSTNYAIQLVAGQSGTCHNQDIRITGQVEVFAGAVRVDDGHIYDISTDIMMPSPSAAYVSTGGVIMDNCRFNIHNVFGSTPQPVVNASFACTMNGGEINIYNGSSASTNTNLITKGTIIKGHDVDTSGNLGLAGGSTYLAIGTAGVSMSSPVGLAIAPYSGNNSAGGSSPNSPLSYLRADGMVQLAGSFTPVSASPILAGTAVGNVNAAHRPDREVDATVYVAGTLAYARVLPTGDVYFCITVNTGQLPTIDAISYKKTNTEYAHIN